ncbi:MAG: N-formylglutamate amidohydrolase [Gammaproteobacteria bacterium]|nr:N-formylglutamate amidohydrolase [Gammaproteobacteria bacterium]
MKSTLIIASYSRLTIDLNRSPYDETLITPISDGIEIPGNQDLSTIDQKSRVEEIFDPYHAAIDREIKRLQGRQSRVGVISMHSFTPSMGGRSRPWEIGILWAKDDRISRPLINSLRSEIDLCIGDNEPYDARENYGYTVESHGEKAEIPGVLIEVRQDLIDSDLGVKKWADKIFQHLNPILLDLALSID